MVRRPDFWKNKKVLVTGFSGFLGSWVTKTLLARGAKVCGLDIKPYRRGTVLAGPDLADIKVIKGSVEDYRLVSSSIKNNSIDYIFHLAAKSLVGECLADPAGAFSVNTMGTRNILEASRRSGKLAGIIVASSDKAYGDNKKLPYREEYPLLGGGPYDASKACADLISQTYFRVYGLPVSIVRCGNIFGPGDFHFSRIVPDAIRSALKGAALMIRSDGTFTRDYIYVEDVARGYLSIAEKMRGRKLYGEAFNLSGESPLSVLALVRKVYKLAGRRPSYRILDTARHEIRHQYLSAAKARRVLGWKCVYSLEEGMRKTIEWYRATARKA